MPALKCVTRPNFFVLGTAKGGTTSLYHWLKQIPDVCLSEPKETWFFDGPDYHNGVDFYLKKYFRRWSGQKIVGEVASSYLYVPFCPQRLQKSVPDARLIAILRNPVDRAYSDWWMLYSGGIETLSFEDAIADNLRRLERGEDLNSEVLWQEHLSSIRKQRKLRYRTYIDYGYYETQLRRYLEFFQETQLKVLCFDDLQRDSSSCVRKILEFLGVDSYTECMDLSIHNVAIPRRSVGRFVNLASKTQIQKFVPPMAKRAINSLFMKMGKERNLDSSTRECLGDHYKDHNQRLRILLNRKLRQWD